MSRMKICQRPTGVHQAWKQLHLVDRCLLILMVVLMAQSTYTLFFPGRDSSLSSSIDIVVRTSAAAIFGYFLSANFAARDGLKQPTPSISPENRTESAESIPNGLSAPKNQIGFVSDTTSTVSGGILAQEDASPAEQPQCCGLQVLVAACIGMFCLGALILLRDIGFGTVSLAESSSLTATVTQFRDFISGCVGFLIGCPSPQQNQ